MGEEARAGMHRRATKAILVGLAITIASGVGAGAAAPPADPSTLNPAALKALVPEKVEWKPTGVPGVDTAVLVGDQAKPGFYVIMNRFHGGSFSRPHYHLNDRYIMVVSGNWWVATGPRFRPEQATVPMKAGTFVVHTAREVHYDGVRTGEPDAVVMIFGQGPGSRIECEGPQAETGPGPCADARRAAGG